MHQSLFVAPFYFFPESEHTHLEHTTQLNWVMSKKRTKLTEVLKLTWTLKFQAIWLPLWLFDNRSTIKANNSFVVFALAARHSRLFNFPFINNHLIPLSCPAASCSLYAITFFLFYTSYIFFLLSFHRCSIELVW